MRKFTRRLAVPLAVIALVVGSAGVASADNAVGDGDGAVPLSTSNLSFGTTVCLGSTTTKDVALGVTAPAAARTPSRTTPSSPFP